jgi:hypothetical protein
MKSFELVAFADVFSPQLIAVFLFQSPSILDPVILTKSILCDRKSMELLSIYYNRFVCMTIYVSRTSTGA